jgi:outer membrane receptor protein involved in Fe transport
MDSTEVVDLAPMVIEGKWDSVRPGISTYTELEVALSGTFAESLAIVPGVAFSSRGDHSNEPIVRGLGYDRVATSLNGLRLPNGSPTRTQAPINQFSGSSYRSVQVALCLPSMANGPPVSGGWIAIENIWPDRQTFLAGQSPELVFRVEGMPDRNGSFWEAQSSGINGPLGYRASAFQSRSGNYKSGDGREVPAHYKDSGASLSLAGRTGSFWLHSMDASFGKQEFTENASLPLDVDDGHFFVFTASHENQSLPYGNWNVRLRYGFTESDSTLSNRYRQAAPVLVVTDTETRAFHADIAAVTSLSESGQIQFGLDTNREERLAIRRRGPVAEDYIWPDTVYQQLGAYAESQLQLNDQTSLRAAIRWDHAVSKAPLAGKTAFGKPILSLFSDYNGIEATNPSQKDSAFSGNLLLEYRPSGTLTVYGGVGTSAQIPPPTERYRAFLNALGGGFELGNPALRPERKWELAAGSVFHSENFRLQVDLYHFQVDDFIWRQSVGSTDGILPLDPPQTVFSYRNVQAAFTGLELQGTWQLTEQFRIPASIEWVDAQLLESGTGYSTGDRLPELPPAEFLISGIWESTFRSITGSLRWTTRLVTSQENELPEIDPLYADSKSFTLHELSVTLQRSDAFTLSITVKNLFDKLYMPYLTPPVSSLRPPSGDLQPGDRIPGAGREFIVTLSGSF